MIPGQDDTERQYAVVIDYVDEDGGRGEKTLRLTSTSGTISRAAAQLVVAFIEMNPTFVKVGYRVDQEEVATAS